MGENAPGVGALDDQDAHQERVDVVPVRELERDGRHYRHRRRRHRAHGGERRRYGEHHPRHQPDVAPDQAQPALYEQAGSAVALRYGEEQRNACKQYEEVTREPPKISSTVRPPPMVPSKNAATMPMTPRLIGLMAAATNINRSKSMEKSSMLTIGSSFPFD